MDKVTILVPATSANLGPGFDCFGIAYKLYNTFVFEKTDGKFSFEGFEDEFANEDNFCVVSFKAAEKAAGKTGAGCKVTLEKCDVPICRGLGSSSTLIVAGAIAYNMLYDAKFDNEKILEIATSVEGHPDNVAPAIYGGLTCSAMGGGAIAVEKYQPAENLHFTVMIPDFKLSTKKAREVLPKMVTREDAIFNISHAALLLSALQTGGEEKIKFALKDKIHQPYRKSLIADYDDVERAAIRCGAAGVCMSGAGPTMLAISTCEIASKLESKLNGLQANWRVLDLKCSGANEPMGCIVLRKE